MATYHSCPNCGNSDSGVRIIQCADCGKVFCSECQGSNLIQLFGCCPDSNCEGNPVTLGFIEDDD